LSRHSDRAKRAMGPGWALMDSFIEEGMKQKPTITIKTKKELTDAEYLDDFDCIEGEVKMGGEVRISDTGIKFFMAWLRKHDLKG